MGPKTLLKRIKALILLVLERLGFTKGNGGRSGGCGSNCDSSDGKQQTWRRPINPHGKVARRV